LLLLLIICKHQLCVGGHPDLNPHLNWLFASNDKPFLDLCGQLELEKLKPPDSQTGLFGLAVPEFLLHSTDSMDRSELF
jgi:hypothetical protein